MEFNTIITAIGSLGFPIVACIFMFYMYTKQQEKHADEVKEMTSAINELKLVIQKILDKLEV